MVNTCYFIMPDNKVSIIWLYQNDLLNFSL